MGSSPRSITVSTWVMASCSSRRGSVTVPSVSMSAALSATRCSTKSTSTTKSRRPKPLALDVAPGMVALAEKALDDAGLQYASRRVEDSGGNVRKCAISVPPAIPAAVSFRVDYQTGIVQVVLVNVDRLERVTLEFHSNAIEEPVLEDLVRLMLGRDSAFLRRAPLAGLHGRPPAASVDSIVRVDSRHRMIDIRHAEERGIANFGWLDSRHTFSFGDYYDAKQMGFGPLRVINEDRVSPARASAPTGTKTWRSSPTSSKVRSNTRTASAPDR